MITHEQATTDKLAVFREQVGEEDAKGRNKMPEAALVKLRAQKEALRTEGCEGERFASALRSVVVNNENLKKLIQRVYCASTPTTFTHMDRRAHKLAWWLAAGYQLGREIDTPAMIMFFSEPVPDEEKMSDMRFAAAWEMKDAAKKKASRIARKIIKEPSVLANVEYEQPEVAVVRKQQKRCALGNKCMRYDNKSRLAGVLPPRWRQYCSEGCKGRAAFLNRAIQPAALAPDPSKISQIQ